MILGAKDTPLGAFKSSPTEHSKPKALEITSCIWKNLAVNMTVRYLLGMSLSTRTSHECAQRYSISRAHIVML